MRLQTARKKRPVQNPLALEDFAVMHFYVAKTSAKPGPSTNSFERIGGRLGQVMIRVAERVPE
jgi:hypothetical protein